MRINARIRLQLAIFGLVSLVAVCVMVFGYIKLPALLGAGRYTVSVELPEAAGLYKNGNVTYRGTEVGRVQDVRLTETGVIAVLSLKSGIEIPSDLDAQVHSQSPVGEQFVALLPRDGTSRPLHNGDVIPASRTSVPPAIDQLLDATNTGLQGIPRGNLKTVIDESYTAIGGLGPEISRFVKGSTSLAIDGRANLDSLDALIDQAQPVLDSQGQTADSISAWASHLANVTGQLRDQDAAVAGVLVKTGPAADEARQLVDRLKPTLPLLLANLVSLGDVALVYQADIEQLLVLLPVTTAIVQTSGVPNRDTNQAYKGGYQSFNLNFNLPPPCLTGFLPTQQQRTPAEVDTPDRPAGDLYCRIPQDSPNNVRGARNIPCETKPGKRAPTVAMCESDQEYVPLNDGTSWKGDPNATLSGQGIPQTPSNTPRAPSDGIPPTLPPPIAAATYDPATGTYTGPDGRIYAQANLANSAPDKQTWQSMLMPSTPK